MSGVLVFGAAEPGGLDPASRGLAALARDLARGFGGGPVVGALVGSGLANAAAAWSAGSLDRLLVVDDPRLEPYASDAFVAAAQAVVAAARPSLVVAPHGIDAAEWMPRLAAGLGAAVLTACSAVTVDGGTLLAVKPVCGGAVDAAYVLTGDLVMLTFAGALPEALPGAPPAEIASIPVPHYARQIEVLAEIPADTGDGPSLKDARIVVAGGLGLGTAEAWGLIEGAAAALGAAVGASRAAVEMGWAPSSRQVGFSGVKVAPDLYVAIGISGAQHHVAGLSRAGTIVAINTDRDAPIFRQARYGVVGDARAVVPALIERLRQRDGRA